jgi:hypothetical protein
MQQELVTLRQAIPVAPVGSASVAATQGATIGAIPTGAIPSGAAEVTPPISGISLMQWIGLKLDSFGGSGSLVEVADWMSLRWFMRIVFAMGHSYWREKLRSGGEVYR